MSDETESFIAYGCHLQSYKKGHENIPALYRDSQYEKCSRLLNSSMRRFVEQYLRACRKTPKDYEKNPAVFRFI